MPLVPVVPNKTFPVLAARAQSFVVKNFGADAKWTRINDAVWHLIPFKEDCAITLSDADAISTSVSAEPNDVLVVLALLARDGIDLLKMEYFSRGGGHLAEVSRDAMTKRLRAWAKDKTLSDEEWQSWAGEIVVKWQPANEGEGAQ